MDGIKLRLPKRVRAGVRKHNAPIRRMGTYVLTRGLGQLATRQHKSYKLRGLSKFWPSLRRTQALAVSLLLLFVVSSVALEIQIFMDGKPNQMSQKARDLLPKTNQKFADLLKYDEQKSTYEYNAGYTGMVNPTDKSDNTGSPRINASFNMDPSKGMTVTDPVNSINFTMKPKFKLDAGKQDKNQVIYRLGKANGHLVYTAQAASVKEDIVLASTGKDKMTFDYELGLDNGLEARLEKDGSLGVYGTSLPLNGAVSTASDQDAQLLEKARQKATKDKLIFTIPAPVVKETNKTKSDVTTHFELEGNTLRVVAEKLKHASYPLSIDPSVYIESAAKFMRGNNESNIDFDVSNELIQKGVLTGARIPSWTGTTALPADRWNHGTVVAGGYVYVIGGNSASTRVSTVYWSKFDPTTYTLTSPNPGNGACTNWCTNTAYDLPAVRDSMSVVAYNGYLYALGGKDNGGARTQTVYYSKIGSNGEPNSWSTDAGSALSTERSYSSAIAYNNKMYLLGGQTNAATGGVTTTEYTDINPDGSLGAWTSTTALPSARWGHASLQYNGYLYLVGGANGTTVQTGVSYIKVNSDGSLASSWVTTTALPTARATFGGTFATIWGGYMYVTGGCSALSATNCTTVISSDTLKLASINADGSITDWTSVAGITTTNTGYGLVGWRNTLYQIGGCNGMTTGNCTNATTTLDTTFYGQINSDGAVSPIDTEANSQPAIGTGAGQVGRTAMGVVIHNGFLYNIGGCITNDCDGAVDVSDNTGYAPIAADGTVGTWTVDTTGGINGTTGLAGFGVAVYNNRVYAVGGSDGSAYVRTVFQAAFAADGSLGAWDATATNRLASAYGHSYAIARADTATAGSLYVIGGCGGATGIGCTSGTGYINDVLKCPLTNSTGAVGTCATTNQLQLSTPVGLMAGIYYANYIYLAGGGTSAGGQSSGVYFATINSSGNIVRADNGAATGGWDTTTSLAGRPRRRGVAVGVNGYIYVIGGHDGSGTPATLSDIQYAKIDQTTGDLGAWTTSPSTITARWNQGAAAANGYVYVVGGCTSGAPPGSCSAQSGVIEKVQVYNNYSASPSAYTSSTNDFATDRLGASAAVLNGYLYIAGGCITADCTNAVNTVEYVQLSADGSIPASWATTTANLGGDRAWGQLETVGGTLYYIGGQSDTATDERSEIYYGTPSSGNVTTWTQASGGIGDTNAQVAQSRTQHSSTVWNNHIYVTGGLDGSAAATSTVYVSPSLAAGGNIAADSWTATTALPSARSGHTAIAYGSNMYILGGFDSTNYLLDVQYVPINSNGTLGGTWVQTEKLPQAVRQADGFASNGFLYLFGGRSATTTCTDNTYVIPINANGSLGYWSQTNVRYTTARYGATAAYNQGKVYLLGGACGATPTYTGAERTYYATLQFQPQIANFSRAIDADSDVFPTKFLANGLDNAEGARWLLNYRSATSGGSSLCGAMTTWGQNTDFGGITLGTPGAYTPKDGSGASTSCARYYFLNLTIDSQNAFGFPEDVSRGPTITDLSFYFTSDPAKRLIHGKTFIEGQQQPLDTPF